MRPPAGVPRPYRFPPFTRRQLANGLTVWLVPVTGSSLVNVHLLLDAGAAAEDEAHGGVAALTAQLMVTGTRRLDASAFAEATERLGIEVSSESSWDSARAAFQALPQYLDAGLALLAEMIRSRASTPASSSGSRPSGWPTSSRPAPSPGASPTSTSCSTPTTPIRPTAASRRGRRRRSGRSSATTSSPSTPLTTDPASPHLVVAGSFDPDAVIALG